MGKAIPRSLPFVKESLALDESVDFLDWYNLLQTPDKRNVGRVLRASYDCIMQYSPPFSYNASYFVMNATGSTARANPDYGDVDLLLFTNTFNSRMSFLSYLEELLEPDFRYRWDKKPGKAYERQGRQVLKLIPLEGKGKTMHLSAQAEIESEEAWKQQDQEPRVVIYRVGDTRGRLDDFPKRPYRYHFSSEGVGITVVRI